MKIYMDVEKNNYRELCFTPFPVMFICTLQGFSGTQGNPVKFTTKNLQCITLFETLDRNFSFLSSNKKNTILQMELSKHQLVCYKGSCA